MNKKIINKDNKKSKYYLWYLLFYKEKQEVCLIMKNQQNNKQEKNDKIDIKKLYGKQCISNVDEFVSYMKLNISERIK